MLTVIQGVGNTIARPNFPTFTLRLPSVLLCLAMCTAAGSSHAEETAKPEPRAAASAAPASAAPNTPGSDMNQARLVYEQAVIAYGERRYKDAILLFQQADALRPNPAFSFNIGTAYEDMGDSAMALSHYRAYLRQLPKAPDRDEVDLRVRRLERVLADKGLQQVTILSNPASAVVELDGKPRGVTPWTGEVAPGAHAVRLTLQGYEPELRDFDLPPGRAIDVPVTLHTPRANVSPKIVNLNEPRSLPEDVATWQYVRPLTWGIFGASLVSVGGALGFELSRSSYEERSRSATDPVERVELHEQAQRREVWAKGLLMLGLGLGVTAIALGYRDIDDGLEQSRLGVCLEWLPGEHGQVGLKGTF